MNVDRVIDVVRVAFIFGGGAALVRGAWMAWPPAGWLVAGAALVGLGLVGAVQRPGKG